MSPTLSKSRYLLGLQCPRLLWLATNEPESIPPPDLATQHVFDQGKLVGEMARKLFPGGLRVPGGALMANVGATRELLARRKPLFEAGVMTGQVNSRADILSPTGVNEWDIVEVKSSTSVKEINIHDLSFQKLCWEDSGLQVRKCYIAHINSQYVRNGEIDPGGLFKLQDVSEEVAAISKGLRERVADMLRIVGTSARPAMPIGPHCRSPYECPMTGCWKGLPEHNVLTLSHGGRKSWELYQEGILNIADIPDGYSLNKMQRIQKACVISGDPHVDRPAIRQFLTSLEYPLYYLDFETFATTIPLFDGTRPFQNIPFQFSLHIEERPGSPAAHHAFLADGRRDPRPELLETLRRLMGGSGSILSYNKSFEKRVLDELATEFPEFAGLAENTTSRMADLMVPFRSFQYYHPAQKGRASLKEVLPAVTGRGYEELTIAGGNEAGPAFLNIFFGEVPPEETARVRRDLMDYCALDTSGMVSIVERLRELAW